jgi:hypothetical protein
VAFYEEMLRLHPEIPVRIDENGCHSFVEIQFAGKWSKHCLGGYPSNLNVQDAENNLEKEQSMEYTDNLTTFTVPEKPPAIKQTEPSSSSSSSSDSEPEPEPEPSRIHKQPKPNPFVAKFSHKEAKVYLTIKEYNFDIINNIAPQGNLLVKLSSDEAVHDYALSLQKTCKDTSKNFIYINSPEELFCKGKFIDRDLETNSGTSRKGRGGKLSNFIDNNADSDSTILINWNNFSNDEIVAYNSIIDDNRQVDGVDVPEGATIIGLYNNAKFGAYKGSDFYSRFSAVSTCPFANADLHTHVSNLVGIAQEPAAESVAATDKIEIFHSKQWKSLLLGKWSLQGDALQFKPGELYNALKSGASSITINNGLWDNAEFREFFEQLMLHKQIEVYGEVLTVPDNFTIYKTAVIDWNLANTYINSWSNQADNIVYDYVLNPNNINTFIRGCIYEDAKLYAQPGILEKHANQELNIFLNRNLSHDKWHELLHNCVIHNVKLNITAAPGINMPGIEHNLAESAEINLSMALENNSSFDRQTTIIQSNDIDATLTNLLTEHRIAELNPIILDVSEYGPSDLIYKLTRKSRDENLEDDKLEFSEQISDVIQKLIDGDTFILTGKFSNDVIDALSSACLGKPFIYINGERKDIQGKLFLVSPENPSLNFTQHYVDNVDLNKKKQSLFANGITEQQIDVLEQVLINNKINNPLARYSMVQILTMCNYLTTNPDANPLDAWKGVYDLPDISDGIYSTNLDLDKSTSDKFLADRLAKVKFGLNKHPFVFISGITGIGKSSLVNEYLPKDEYTVFNGESELLGWATSPPDGKIKVLFIDEANISDEDYSKFESLFRIPPYILINGKLIELTAEHKVILAGNPMSYGGERHLPSLVARHGSAVFFDVIPPAALYHNVIEPILSTHVRDTALTEQIGSIFIQTYQHIFSLDKEQSLISPRELQSMTELLTALHAENNYSQDQLINLSKNIAFNFSRSLVPIEESSKFNSWFIDTINDGNDLVDDRSHTEAKTTDFTLTESRLKTQKIMADLLSVRKFKQEHGQTKPGGINGLVIEGEPGTGKSHFVLDYLVSNGFTEARLDDDTPKTDNIFYKLPVKMSPKEKEKYLIKAFHEGAVVVIDEINSSPMMEKLINDLLMGWHKGKIADKPGFTIFATQNPIDMAGRKATSEALQRRMFKQEFPPYTEPEMQKILVGKGLPEEKTKKHISLYQEAIEIAHKENKEPVPVFRDLVKHAKKYLKKFTSQAKTASGKQVVDKPLQPATDSSKYILSQFKTSYTEGKQKIKEEHKSTSKDGSKFKK